MSSIQTIIIAVLASATLSSIGTYFIVSPAPCPQVTLKSVAEQQYGRKSNKELCGDTNSIFHDGACVKCPRGMTASNYGKCSGFPNQGVIQGDGKGW
jgi:hypothetical protein